MDINGKNSRMIESGWAVVPIFNKFENKLYVRSGYYQVPLFAGPVDKQLIEEMRKYADPNDFLKETLRK